MNVVIVSTSFLFLIISVILLGLHHAATHDGEIFTIPDFKKGFNGLFSTHEGLMLFFGILFGGIAVGGALL